MKAKTKNKKIVILGQEIMPGKGANLNLEVARLHTYTPVQIPVIVERAKEDGPTILLMAGMHGNEINGMEIIRRMIRKGWNKPTKGTIICVPVFNILGFLSLQRELPDRRDLNRSFPGSKNGSLAAQFAYHFLEEITPVADYVIDFHTGSNQRNNFAQIRCEFEDAESLELAKVFNPPFIVNSSYIHKSLREEMHKRGKKILLFEGGRDNNIEERIVQEGLDGVKRLLDHLDIRHFRVEATHDRVPVLITESRWLRAPHSGMFQSIVVNGSRIETDEVLGMVTDPFGKVERKIKAAAAGHVICVNESPVVNKGDALFHIGV